MCGIRTGALPPTPTPLPHTCMHTRAHTRTNTRPTPQARRRTRFTFGSTGALATGATGAPRSAATLACPYRVCVLRAKGFVLVAH